MFDGLPGDGMPELLFDEAHHLGRRECERKARTMGKRAG